MHLYLELMGFMLNLIDYLKYACRYLYVMQCNIKNYINYAPANLKI